MLGGGGGEPRPVPRACHFENLLRGLEIRHQRPALQHSQQEEHPVEALGGAVQCSRLQARLALPALPQSAAGHSPPGQAPRCPPSPPATPRPAD